MGVSRRNQDSISRLETDNLALELYLQRALNDATGMPDFAPFGV
jgi:hypothetical protein